MKKKRILGIVLAILGMLGFFCFYGGVGGIEIGSASLIKGTFFSLFGALILTLVIFFGIPYYDKID